jgi:uncharacterized repeat protein (TIGR01451 family)
VLGVEVEDRAGRVASRGLQVEVLDSRPTLTLAAAESVLEDQPVMLQLNVSLPSAGETIDRVDIDCDFTGSFVATLSSPDTGGIACPGFPTPGARRIAARAVDDEGEASALVEHDVQITAVNDPPGFLSTALSAALEDAGEIRITGWASSLSAGPEDAVDEIGQTLRFELVGTSRPELFAVLPALDSDGELRFVPAADANGDSEVSFRLCDDGIPVACSVPGVGTLRVIAVNDAPDTQFVSLPVLPRGDGGPREIPGFASFDAGPGDEDLTQQAVDFPIAALLDPDGILTANGILVDRFGTLHLDLSGAPGVAAVSLRVQDNGGTADGGIDLSPERLFTIAVGDGSDLQLALDNGVERLVVGDRTRYALVIGNAGPDVVTGAILTLLLPSGLVDAVWQCRADLSSAPCPQPDQGLGNLVSRIDLAVDDFLRFDYDAEVENAGTSSIQLVARVALPPGLAPISPENDIASDTDALLPRTLHLDSFEAQSSEGLSNPAAQHALRAP